MNEATNAVAALFSALAKAQGEFKPIEKNRTVLIPTRQGSTYTFRYADLEEILRKTRPALAANGLALIQCMEPTEAGPYLSCVLTHSAGFKIVSSHQLPKNADADPKAFGSLITYHRRYLVTAMLGVAADDDLDEDGQGSGCQSKSPQQEAQKRKAQATAQQPAETEMLNRKRWSHPWAKRTHCTKGHEYMVSGFSIAKDGSRVCLICQRDHKRNQRATKKGV